MSPSNCLLVLAALAYSAAAFGWAGRWGTTSVRCHTNSPLCAMPVSSLDLQVLPDVQADAAYLRASVKKWLDEEYIVQPIHEKIGLLCGDIYLQARQRGVGDLGEMLLDVGTALEKVPFENAFVNCWDVANKVADLLMGQMEQRDRALSAGSGALETLHTPHPFKTASSLALTPAVLLETVQALPSEFSRYSFLQRLLDREVPLQAVAPIAAICLGFRSVPQGSEDAVVMQVQEAAAFGWEGLGYVPDFADLQDEALGRRIALDLPEDLGGVDVAVEAVIGLEIYGQMKRSGDSDIQRRVLVTQWLYVQNFFDDFPRSKRFIPKHLEYRLEE